MSFSTDTDSISRGREFMAGQSVVICGLARDCAERLPAMIQQLEQLGEMFRSYEVIVVENDSSDNTGALLTAWSDANPRVRTVRFSGVKQSSSSTTTTNNQPGWFQPDRIQRICFARNIYLAELSTTKSDYVVVVDMDLHSIDLDGIATSFANPMKWRAVASNGLRYTLRSPLRPRVYWDTYAYEPDGGFTHDTQTRADIRQSQKTLELLLRNGEWHVAKSAFGGLCIYRSDALKQVEYAVLPNNDPAIPWLCEHVGLHRAIYQHDPLFKVHINPAQVVTYETVFKTVSRSVSGQINRLRKSFSFPKNPMQC